MCAVPLPLKRRAVQKQVSQRQPDRKSRERVHDGVGGGTSALKRPSQLTDATERNQSDISQEKCVGENGSNGEGSRSTVDSKFESLLNQISSLQATVNNLLSILTSILPSLLKTNPEAAAKISALERPQSSS